MELLNVCRSYFNTFNELISFNKNDAKTNSLAILKLLSYFTIIIPAGFVVTYWILKGRIKVKDEPSKLDEKVNFVQQKVIKDQLLQQSEEQSIQQADLNNNSIQQADLNNNSSNQPVLANSPFAESETGVDLPLLQQSEEQFLYLSDLPAELQLRIASYLGLEDWKKTKLNQVNQQFHAIFIEFAPSFLENHANQFNFTNIFAICEHCGDRISKLDLSHIGNLTDEGLKSLIELCPNLRELNVSGCKKITDKGLKSLLNSLLNLQKLNLANTDIIDETLQMLKSLKDLKELNVSGCKKITDEGLKSLLNSLVNIEKLNLAKTNITNEILPELATLKNLKELNLSGCKGLIEELNSSSMLLFINTQLEKLNLSGNHNVVKDKTLENLKKSLKKLKELNLSGYNNRINIKREDSLLGWTSLEKLNLASTTITNEELQKLKHLINLKELDLSWCRHITDEGIEALLHSLPNLKKLNLANTYITKELQIKILQKLKSLIS